jgi:restriction system protein
MAVPDFQSLMRPLLDVLDDDRDYPIKAMRDELAELLCLDQSAREELIPSGRVTVFNNRVGWAATYLYRAGLIERPRRAVYKITPRGHEVLTRHPDRVDLRVLSEFEEFEAFRQTRRQPQGSTPAHTADEQTPEEQIESSYLELRSALAEDLLDRIHDQTPEFFEQLVIDVLHAMGYGGGQEDSSERLGSSGDEGVDGVIREDRLGLDNIYIQAKRWTNTVGRPEIQKFSGALQGQNATKGVFITTSTFSADAIEFSEKVTPRIILVDGKELAQLMIEHDVGVTTARQYLLKRLDLDYFATEDGAPEATTAPSTERLPPASH